MTPIFSEPDTKCEVQNLKSALRVREMSTE